MIGIVSRLEEFSPEQLVDLYKQIREMHDNALYPASSALWILLLDIATIGREKSETWFQEQIIEFDRNRISQKHAQRGE